jgi:thymidylate synthase (FAD)
MKIIKPGVEFFGAVPTNCDKAIKFIEMAGRTCYKSEDKITPDSSKDFVTRLIKNKHLAMVEHSNFVLRMDQLIRENSNLIAVIESLCGKFLNVTQDDEYIYIGGNLTAWYQRGNVIGWYDSIFSMFAEIYTDLFDIHIFNPPGSIWKVCPHDEIPQELHRYSAKFICDRGVSHELVRHRLCSFAQESTRYVNYAGKDMEFIEPDDFDSWSERSKDIFTYTCVDAMENYQQLVSNQELKPQQARAVLPNALKTEIIVTADMAEWMHIRKLRTAKDAHPDMQRVMNMMPWTEF